jgi:hypothetical protein
MEIGSMEPYTFLEHPSSLINIIPKSSMLPFFFYELLKSVEEK